MSGPLPPEKRVLPTLNQDGTRRWVRPRLYRGRYLRARTAVGWALMALFVVIPFITWNGKPLVLLDVPRREFTLFGTTFLPTDGVLLMFLLLSIFVVVILLTALLGRVWCGWGCPQTVYMEFVFRPIERLFEGDSFAQMRLDRDGPNTRRVLKNIAFLAVSAVIANVFLAYFVGVQALSRWVTQSPFDQPTPFLVMAVTTGLVFFDFAFFREQMCTVVCPYARLQSVLLDTQSLIVGYDFNRGEPRGKKGTATGDCVDCKACVVACPTGIDIRNGLQLECIGCTQCIDACDGVMDKLKRPRGLIRYTSQDALQHPDRPRRILRPRVVIYPLVLLALIGGLVFTGRGRDGAEVTVLRGIGAPFVDDGRAIRNQLRIKVRNRSGEARAYHIALEDAAGATLIAPENPVRVAAGQQVETGVFVVAPRSFFTDGVHPVTVSVTDDAGFSWKTQYKVLGPKR